MGRKRIYKSERSYKKAKIRWVQKSQKKTMTSLNIRLHNEYDREVIEQIKKQPNKTNYIRTLVQQDIDKLPKD